MNEIIEAIYDRLVSLLSVDVFDQTPQDYNTFPYVQINVPSSTSADTDTENAFESLIEIVSFSRYRGSEQINNLNQEVYDALHRWAFPDTATFGISTINQLSSTISRSPDGITRDSIQIFEIIFEPKP